MVPAAYEYKDVHVNVKLVDPAAAHRVPVGQLVSLFAHYAPLANKAVHLLLIHMLFAGQLYFII